MSLKWEYLESGLERGGVVFSSTFLVGVHLDFSSLPEYSPKVSDLFGCFYVV